MAKLLRFLGLRPPYLDIETETYSYHTSKLQFIKEIITHNIAIIHILYDGMPVKIKFHPGWIIELGISSSQYKCTDNNITDNNIKDFLRIMENIDLMCKYCSSSYNTYSKFFDRKAFIFTNVIKNEANHNYILIDHLYNRGSYNSYSRENNYYSYKCKIILYINDNTSEDISPEGISPEDILSKNNKDMDCIICTENIRNTILLPCKHFSICGNCSRKIKICPVCRHTISERITGYV